MITQCARRFPATVPAVAITIAGLATASTARADYLSDLWKGRPEPFCPLAFAAGCRTTLSADLVFAHQPVSSDDNGKETYFRAALEVALGKLVAPDLHLGPALEVGVQDGHFMTGFHIVPKARARYWIAGSAVSLDLALGTYLGRSWLDTGDAPRNWLGGQVDGGFGILGSLYFLGGFAVIADPAGIYGTQTQAFVGARISLLTIGVAAGLALKR